MTKKRPYYDPYQGLSAEMYDVWFQSTSSEDLVFYRRMIDEVPGAALEIGCGTGRLLLPYLEDGLEVYGLDVSNDMLEICRQKANLLGLSPVLYHQSMQDLSLERRFTTIYVPACSFMLVSDREEAMETLRRFHHHLEETGQLIISTRLGWGESSINANNEKSAQDPKAWRLRRIGVRKSDDADIVVSEAIIRDVIEQVQTGLYRYEVYKNGQLEQTYLEILKLRWYYKYELTLMLEKVGFHDIFVHGDYSAEAISDGPSVMLFRARK